MSTLPPSDDSNLSTDPLLSSTLPAPKRSRNPIRWLYDWVLSWAHSRFGTIALAGISFAESSFFPVPPDVLQIALSVERPKRSFFYAAVSAVASTVGALLGWIIGSFLWSTLAPYFLGHVFSEEIFNQVQGLFTKYSFWILFAAAFTPIPFKVFTIAGGVMNLACVPFLLACAVGRSMRFFLVATLLYIFGPKVKIFIDKWFGLLTTILLVLVVLGFYVIRYLLPA